MSNELLYKAIYILRDETDKEYIIQGKGESPELAEARAKKTIRELRNSMATKLSFSSVSYIKENLGDADKNSKV